MNIQTPQHASSLSNLVGVGLYTPAEASRLTGIGAGRIVRWLKGHHAGGKSYERLWSPQVDIGDGHVYLGFRDLMEVRVANAFIAGAGLNPQKVRRAIEIARDLIGEERPLSTTRFRTDGRSVFLQAFEEDGSVKLIDLFKSQYAFREIIEPTLKTIDFGEDGIPVRWWPAGRAARIVLDPQRCFGRPIEAGSAVPVALLAAAAAAEGSEAKAARVWDVPVSAIRRAVEFQNELAYRRAA